MTRVQVEYQVQQEQVRVGVPCFMFVIFQVRAEYRIESKQVPQSIPQRPLQVCWSLVLEITVIIHAGTSVTTLFSQNLTVYLRLGHLYAYVMTMP